MALASGPAVRALASPGRLGLGGCGAPRRRAYEWGVRSTRKPEPRPLHRVHEIPGVEPITYEGKMHFVPWLAQPIFPPWERGWDDPRFRRPVPIHEHPRYKDQPCYVFHQRCRLLEGEAARQTGGDPVLCSALTPTDPAWGHGFFLCEVEPEWHPSSKSCQDQVGYKGQCL